MAEQVWVRTHDPTASVASEQSTRDRTFKVAMMATKLNAQVIIKNLQNMHEKSLPPTGARRRMELEYQDWARLQGRDHARADLSTAPWGWRSW